MEERYLTPLGQSPRSFTQKVEEISDMTGRAKRLTLTNLHRQVELVRAELMRRGARLAKAQADGDANQVDKQTKGIALSCRQLEALDAEIKARIARVG